LNGQRWVFRTGVWVTPQGLPQSVTAGPVGVLELSQWTDHWGTLFGVTALGETYAPTRDTPFYSTGTLLVDLLARLRVDAPGFHILGGYRVVPWSNQHYASVGLAVWRPLPVPFLRLEFRGLGGHNLGLENRWRSYIDASGALTIHRESLAISLGLRHLAAMSAVESTFAISGPFAALRVDF
jgi:hypothetical protein